MDVCLHDVALERQLIDARNDDNISRRLRQSADLAAVQRIQSDESAAVSRQTNPSIATHLTLLATMIMSI